MTASTKNDSKSSGDPPSRLLMAGPVSGSAEEHPERAIGSMGACGASHTYNELGGTGWARNCEGGKTFHFFDDGRSLCGKQILHRPTFQGVDEYQFLIPFSSRGPELELPSYVASVSLEVLAGSPDAVKVGRSLRARAALERVKLDADCGTCQAVIGRRTSRRLRDPIARPAG